VLRRIFGHESDGMSDWSIEKLRDVEHLNLFSSPDGIGMS
jgi:hypothetical protein